jgi:hypothetical protein
MKCESERQSMGETTMQQAEDAAAAQIQVDLAKN